LQARAGRELLLRYTIAAAIVAFFLAWDILYNQSEYIARGVSLLYKAAHWVGL